MPGLNFKEEFEPKIRCGDKKQTIRATRKYPIKQGDNLYLFTGMRTQNCRRLRSTRCDEEHYIFIDTNKTIILGNKLLTFEEAERLAREDGFESFNDFINFFKTTHGLPFEGQLIRWL